MTTTTTTKITHVVVRTAYQYICKLEPKGHRLFSADGAFFLTDNSGANPDTTDDGPLVVDRRRPIYIRKGNATVPVIRADGSEARTFVGFEGAERLMQYVDIKAEITPEALPLVALIRRIG